MRDNQRAPLRVGDRVRPTCVLADQPPLATYVITVLDPDNLHARIVAEHNPNGRDWRLPIAMIYVWPEPKASS